MLTLLAEDQLGFVFLGDSQTSAPGELSDSVHYAIQ